MKNNVFLVTGGAGFVGSSLVKMLLARNSGVVVYDNFSTGRKEFLPLDNEQLHIVEGDITDISKLKKVFEEFKPSVVYHLAALHYIPYCNANPLETVMVNVNGTETLIECCQRAEIEKFIFTSSAAVYGINDRSNSEEDPVIPLDIYGNTKYFGEHLVRLYHSTSKVPCVVARLFNVYGCNETNDHVVPAILEQLKDNAQIKLGNMEPKRDYIYVEDVSKALISIEENCNGPFDIFNVGTGKEYSVIDLIKIISGLTSIDIQVQQEASRKRNSDRLHLLADITRITRATGWQPEYEIHQGLESLITAEYSGLIKNWKNCNAKAEN